MSKVLDFDEYTIAWVAVLEIEAEAALGMLDKKHDGYFETGRGDDYIYIGGELNGHKIVVATWPAGQNYGPGAAAALVNQVKARFSNIWFALLVGVAAGLPNHSPKPPAKLRDIRLGDVLVCVPDKDSVGIIHYDLGRDTEEGFFPNGRQAETPAIVRSAIRNIQLTKKKPFREGNTLAEYLANVQRADEDGRFLCPSQSEDKLFARSEDTLVTREPRDESERTKVWYGNIGSGSSLVRNPIRRDELRDKYDLIGLEMEAAGIMNTLPTGVIRGVCDYGDSKKDKIWQPYAAAAAAAYAKGILCTINPKVKAQTGMIKAKHLSGTSILRSDSIFSQQRLIPREDVKEFLADAFRGAGTARVVIHGLPGIGKSTMARHFAQQHQGDMAVLWIPAATEADMTIAFKQYAQQISEEDADYPEPVSLVGRLLSERFPGNWVVILDGLDDTSINVQRYNFADLPASKILVTTRNKGLASHIGATHILPINPLDETTALSLLSTYMFTGPMPSSQNGLRETEISQAEKEARRRLVKELGGLPLAISIIGSSMREDGRASDIKCQTYLTWSDDVKDILLEQDPEFPDYSSSVWKAFTFAFQKLLLDTAANQHTKSMACFAASCENGSNFAGYLRLYRQIRSGNGNNVSGCAAMDQMKFLDNGFFEVTIAKLAASNLITLNWIEDGPITSPYIEIHSLVRRWLERRNRNQILAYTSPKLWLLGFGMYDQILQDQVGLKDFAPLINEMTAHLSKVPGVAQNSCVPTTQIIFPFLIDAHRGLAKSIAHLPPSSAPQSRLHEFSKHLESEIAESYTNNLEDLDWRIVFRDFMEEFKEQVDYAAKSDANRQEYTLKDFFLNTLDDHECIPIAFRLATPSDFSCVGRASFIEAFAVEIIDAVECLLDKHLSKEATRQLGNLPREEFGEPISQWCRRWNDDIEEIISRSLDRVVAKRIMGDDIETHPTERPTPMTSVSGAEGSLGFLTAMTSSDKPRNAFFAVLRRATIAATGQFLSTSPVVGILDGLRDEFGDACAAPLREHLGERALSMQHGSIPQFPTSEARDDSFSMLWQLAWPMRFPCALESLIAQQVVDSISKDLKNSAREGFLAAIKDYCLSAVSDDSSEVAEYLTEEVFQESGISNLFPNWIASGWIDLPNDNDEEEPSYIRLLDEARSLLLEAMRLIYRNHDDIPGRDMALYAVKRTLACRKELHNTVMGRLNQPDLTDQTGVGAFFAKIYFADCDLGLRQVYSLLHDSNLKNDVDLLEALVSVEDQWSRHKEHPSSTEE